VALPATPFWFLRHGETDYNARGLSQGALDIALNETGRAQARAAGLALAGRGIEGILCSPMLRARQTAEIVNEQLGLETAFVPDLREVKFGGMEGQPLQPWFAAWLAGRATPEGAESFAQVLARVAAIMPVILTRGLKLVVAHGGVFRALAVLMDLPTEGLTHNAEPLFCEPGAAGWRVTSGSAPADG
jgi:broad specificity phosphatase PhoE